MKNTTYYTHNKKGKKYSILNLCKYQHNNIWYDAITYQDVESNKIYVMQENQFDKEHSIWNKK